MPWWGVPVTWEGQGAHTHVARLPRPTTHSHGTPPTRSSYPFSRSWNETEDGTHYPKLADLQ